MSRPSRLRCRVGLVTLLDHPFNDGQWGMLKPRDLRPVLHRRLRPAVAVAFDGVPAAAFPLDQPVLGHLGANRLQVKDLPALHGGDRAVRQPGTAPAAAARLMADLPVRPDRLPQRHPLVPVLPAGLAAARLRSSLAEASRPSLGGHVGAFFRVYPCGKPNDSIRGVDLNHPVEAAKGRRVFELRPADNPY